MSQIPSITDSYDYLKPNGYRLTIANLKNTNYDCQAVKLPSLTLGNYDYNTPFVAIPVPGDKLVFGRFTVEFIVQDKLQNYLEIFRWMQALGFPSSYNQFTNLPNIAKNKNNLDAASPSYSDATLLILSGQNNHNLSIKFVDMYPIELSEIDLDIRTEPVNPVTAVATFAYREFDFNLE